VATRSVPGLDFHLLDGEQAGAHAEEFHALHAEVYADPPYRQGDDQEYPRRFAVQRRQPGFVLAEARNGGYLVGYAAGLAALDWRRLARTRAGPDAPVADVLVTDLPGP